MMKHENVRGFSISTLGFRRNGSTLALKNRILCSHFSPVVCISLERVGIEWFLRCGSNGRGDGSTSILRAVLTNASIDAARMSNLQKALRAIRMKHKSAAAVNVIILVMFMSFACKTIDSTIRNAMVVNLKISYCFVRADNNCYWHNIFVI